MLNKLLSCFDLLVGKMDKIACFCKARNGKRLGVCSMAVLCCTVVSFMGTDALKNIPVIKSAYYDTVVANWPKFVDFLSADIGKAIFSVALLAICMCYLFRWLYRPFATLIAHSTMGHNLSLLHESLKKSFWFVRRCIDVQLPSKNASEDQIVAAICAQDELFKKIRERNWCSTVFYYGVAHTPLVFRLGFQWGQTMKIRFLHRFRSTEDEQEFQELPPYVEEKMAFRLSDRLDELNYNSNSKHMIVSIATTYPIKNEDITCIDPLNTMLRYDMQVDLMGFDFFNSYQKIHSYADRIVYDLRERVKERGIETIHLVISSSVPFTFYLAQQMNTHQFCKIIVYHYDHGKYTWGIDVAETDAKKAIRWAGSVDNATVV